MLAKDYIKEHIKRGYRSKAHVLAIIEDKKSWFHVHWDEKIPTQYRVVISITS